MCVLEFLVLTTLYPSMEATECPVCGVSISLSHANEHIDTCLKSRETSETDADHTPGKVGCLSDAKSERKRQSVLSFGTPKSSTGRLKRRKVEEDKGGVECKAM